MYKALKDNSKLTETKARVVQMEHNAELQAQYYYSLADKYTEIREYRHDINNLVAAVELLLHNEISRRDGEEMLSEIKEKAAQTSVPIFCSNPVANAILWHKKQESEKLGIDIEISIDKNEDFPFEKTDVCSVFSNLLDNAIREAANQPQPFVKVSSNRDMNMIFIEVRNSSSRKDISNEKKLKSTKKDGTLHGYGMEIIGKIAQKCNGDFALTADGSEAKAVVALSTEKIK